MSTAAAPLSEGRFPPLTLDDLTADQRRAYNEIVHGRRASGAQLFRILGDDGELLGPFGPMVRHPAVGQPLQALGAALRYNGCLSPSAREIVICTVGLARECQYEWDAHAAVARSVGVPEPVLEALRLNHSPAELIGEDRTARRLAVALLTQQPVDDDLFAEARRDLGMEGVVEVVALVGYYYTLADLIKVFDLDRSATTGNDPAV